MHKIGYFLLLLSISSFSFAESPLSLGQTKSKIKQIDNHINNLQITLSTASNKRSQLQKDLSITEKQIGEEVGQLHQLQLAMNQGDQKIADLKREIKIQGELLQVQRENLMKHVQARYKMGSNQPVKFMLNQEDPYAISRLLTYYQYLIQSRQNVIDQISETQKSFDENNQKLIKEHAENKRLHEASLRKQQELEKSKKQHASLINSLNLTIQNKETQLQEAKRDKNNLTVLMKSLLAESVIQPFHPFPTMRKKLPHPVRVSAHLIKKMNQGVTFFADEGMPVNAVYPGKIVFSDWLKGYGLLLIVDHGQGFMTLYANNQSLFKHKGEQVRQGEQVANVGHTGGLQQNGLYFEVRHGGKAVPPLEWLS